MYFRKRFCSVSFFFFGKSILELEKKNKAFETHPQAGELDKESSADLAIVSAKVSPNRGIK